MAVHLQAPDKWCNQWKVYVEDRHGAETVSRYFDSEGDAVRQGDIWKTEMDRTSVTIGSSPALYER